ncbi:MAG TPA: response regulator transcription factor [Pyrinomonadaceae bacterium]|jgi:DNA-binding NarL/FixJ family response regulator
MQNPISILLVENCLFTRIGVSEVLKREDDFKIVGEADSGARGLKLFKKLKPQVVILALRLPDSCAVDVIEKYLAIAPETKILVFAEHTGDAEIRNTFKKGALGFIRKDVMVKEAFVKALRTVSAGQKYIPSEIAEIISENVTGDDITPTEKKILEMMVKGLSNKQIAFEQNISINTVKSHLQKIFDKLGAPNRISAAVIAVKRGFIHFDF